MRNIVNALFVRDGRILLARRSPHRPTYAGLWSFPGGHVKQNETLIEALLREVREEVGVTPTTFGLIGIIVDPNATTTDAATYHMYAITAWDNSQPSLVGDDTLNCSGSRRPTQMIYRTLRLWNTDHYSAARLLSSLVRRKR